MWCINEIYIFLVGERWFGYISIENLGDEERFISGRFVWYNYMVVIYIFRGNGILIFILVIDILRVFYMSEVKCEYIKRVCNWNIVNRKWFGFYV